MQVLLHFRRHDGMPHVGRTEHIWQLECLFIRMNATSSLRRCVLFESSVNPCLHQYLDAMSIARVMQRNLPCLRSVRLSLLAWCLLLLAVLSFARPSRRSSFVLEDAPLPEASLGGRDNSHDALSTARYNRNSMTTLDEKMLKPQKRAFKPAQGRFRTSEHHKLMKRMDDDHQTSLPPPRHTRLPRGHQKSAPPGFERIPELELAEQRTQHLGHPVAQRPQSRHAEPGLQAPSVHENPSMMADHHMPESRTETAHLIPVASMSSHGSSHTSSHVHPERPSALQPVAVPAGRTRVQRPNRAKQREAARLQKAAEEARIVNRLKKDRHFKVLLNDERHYFHELKDAEREMQSRGVSPEEKERLLHDKKVIFDIAQKRLTDYSEWLRRAPSRDST